jgi:hypothetical protein
MSININFIKYLFIFAAGFLLCLFLLRSCNAPKPCPGNTAHKESADTSSKVIADQSSDWHVDPIPVSTDSMGSPGDIEGAIRTGQYREQTQAPVRIDSFIAYDPVDTPAIVARFPYVHNQYMETYHFPEGDVDVESDVKGELSKQRAFLRNFKQSVITKTITNTVQAPVKAIRVYGSVVAQGSMIYPLQAFGIGAMVQFKNNNAIELDALYTRIPGGIVYQGSYKTLIHL